MKKRNIMRSILTTCFVVTIAMVTACGVEEKSTGKTKETGKKVEKTAEMTIEPEETVAPIKIEKNTLLYSWKIGGENAPGYEDKDEKRLPDCFYLSGKRVFLDDSVNQRILIYKDGKFEKSIALEWNCDIKRMYYSATEHILKTVYEDLSCSKGPVYYAADFNVEDGTIISEKKISNTKNVLEDFYYQEDGILHTFYLNGSEDKKEQKNIKKVKKVFSKDIYCDVFYFDKRQDKIDIFCSKTHSLQNGMIQEEWITKVENGKVSMYAVPEPHENVLEAGAMARINGNLYQLAVTKEKVSIYALKEKEWMGDSVKGYMRQIQ